MNHQTFNSGSQRKGCMERNLQVLVWTEFQIFQVRRDWMDRVKWWPMAVIVPSPMRWSWVSQQGTFFPPKYEQTLRLMVYLEKACC